MESQRWDSISPRIDNAISFVWTDTVQNKLYISSYYWKYFGLEKSGHLGKYNGYNWEPFKKGLLGINGFDDNLAVIHDAYHYKSKILFGGFFWGGDTCRTAHLMYYDRTNFSKFYPEPFKLNNSNNSEIRSILEFKDTLYIGGTFDTIQNKKSNGLAKLYGNQWKPIDFNMHSGNATITKIINYKNEMHIVGFWSNGIIGDGLSGILKYSSGNWQSVGGGIQGGGLNYAKCAVVYKDELYVAGRFYKASGNAGHNIMRWDGTTWHDVGLTADTTGGEIHKMKVLNGLLYVTGSFTNFGTTRANGLARWDGTTWCGGSDEFIGSNAVDLDMLNNKLIVGGAFRIERGVADGSKYQALTQLRCDDLCSDTCKYKLPEYGPAIANGFSIYPNPSNGIFTINANGFIPNNTQLTVYNNLGQLVYKDVYTQNINLQNLANALYYIQINVNNKLYNYKIIKE